MVYNDTTNYSGVLQIAETKTDVGLGYFTGDATRLKQITATANQIVHELWNVCFKASGSWKFDDGNYTNLPQSTTELTSGTNKYALPSEALTVESVQIKDRNGNYVRIKPLDIINSKAIDYSKTGVPTQYSLVNGTIILDITPDYTATEGLKVYFERQAVEFATTDTTRTPGIPSPFHYLVPTGIAIEWLKVKQPQSPSLPLYMADYEKGKQELADLISERFRDEGAPVMKMSNMNCE